ncbi:hypothetical protein [Xanthomarina sp. F2636L]|uniref:hypothetical protein n=1 Tax=Xanthomarina sp. F2636L TaxID=2996018 RepID=UPI00225E6CB6|nr:hypothetical protein [Xanthomarina sp. F2636L]MCX7549875.1 hypothetical protein [Xanthomarina sp. F2636L]
MKWLKILGVLILILVLGFFIAQYIIKSKVENALATKLPETLKITYTDLDLSLWKGQIILDNIKLTNFGKTIQEPNAEVQLKQFAVSGFSFWNFLINNVVQIDDVFFKNPNITYYHNAIIPKEEYQVSQEKSFDKEVEIKEIRIDKGYIKVLDTETDSLKLEMQQVNFKLNEIVYNKKTKNQKIPFNYGSYQILFDSFFGQMSDYENVTIEHAKLTNEAAGFEGLKLYTKYSKETLSTIIPFERDHYNLHLDSLIVEKPNFGVVRDTTWQFASEKIAIYQPDFKVYRDKLVADDERIKPLYSKMLRDLKFNLNIENVLIHDAKISYSEKVKLDKTAGTILFTDFQADIKHVSNTYQAPTKTVLTIDSNFMEHAPLHVVWSFDVNNQTDLFELQADIGILKAEYLNKFTKPNLNVKLEGELDKTYFTISGTDEKSMIDFKMKYKDFNVVILKSNGDEKNQFLSDVVNIFVSKNSETKTHIFKEATKDHIERSKTQSVFNFIWISTRAGLLKTMTID